MWWASRHHFTLFRSLQALLQQSTIAKKVFARDTYIRKKTETRWFWKKRLRVRQRNMSSAKRLSKEPLGISSRRRSRIFSWRQYVSFGFFSQKEVCRQKLIQFFFFLKCNLFMVYGPIAHFLSSLDTLNTFNERIRDIFLGKHRDSLPPIEAFIWIDVRDLAFAHIRAAQRSEAAGKRFFITAGRYFNRQIADIIVEEFPDLREKIAGKEVKGDFDSEGTYRLTFLRIFTFHSTSSFFWLICEADHDLIGTYKYDNSQIRDILGINFRSLKECVVDTVKSLQTLPEHREWNDDTCVYMRPPELECIYEIQTLGPNLNLKFMEPSTLSIETSFTSPSFPKLNIMKVDQSISNRTPMKHPPRIIISFTCSTQTVPFQRNEENKISITLPYVWSSLTSGCPTRPDPWSAIHIEIVIEIDFCPRFIHSFSTLSTNQYNHHTPSTSTFIYKILIFNILFIFR